MVVKCEAVDVIQLFHDVIKLCAVLNTVMKNRISQEVRGISTHLSAPLKGPAAPCSSHPRRSSFVSIPVYGRLPGGGSQGNRSYLLRNLSPWSDLNLSRKTVKNESKLEGRRFTL
jgi:hypothetical protein